MLPPSGPDTMPVVIRCSRSQVGVRLAWSGAVNGVFTFNTAVEAEVEVADWLDANLGRGRLVELHSGSRLVGVATKPPMARALLARALRLLGT